MYIYFGRLTIYLWKHLFFGFGRWLLAALWTSLSLVQRLNGKCWWMLKVGSSPRSWRCQRRSWGKNMWPKRYEEKETQKHKKVKMDDRNNETNWKNIMNIQQCCKLGNLGSLIGWESSGLQRTQIGFWRKHCVTSARWLLLFLEGTKNTKEEYLSLEFWPNAMATMSIVVAVKVQRYFVSFFWFMIYVLWWDLMRHDDLQIG